jgi:hypothetical protein
VVCMHSSLEILSPLNARLEYDGCSSGLELEGSVVRLTQPASGMLPATGNLVAVCGGSEEYRRVWTHG